jgi:ferredoxin-nitrite reductase
MDPQALINPRSLVAALDDAISQHEGFAGLPAKFSVGFDGGEGVSVRNRRNDLWFVATAGQPGSDGDRPVFFRLFIHSGEGRELDTGMLRPEDCVSLVVKIAQMYLAHVERLHGPATGKKPRLGHVFAQQGMTWFYERVGQFLPFTVNPLPSFVLKRLWTVSLPT